MWILNISSLRAAPSVKSQCQAQLLHWRVLELENGHRILALGTWPTIRPSLGEHSDIQAW